MVVARRFEAVELSLETSEAFALVDLAVFDSGDPAAEVHEQGGESETDREDGADDGESFRSHEGTVPQAGLAGGAVLPLSKRRRTLIAAPEFRGDRWRRRARACFRQLALPSLELPDSKEPRRSC